MNGPMYLRSAGDMDVVIGHYVPTFVSEGERLVVYDGKRAFVSPENFEWMKTATSDELGAMRVSKINGAPKGWWTPKMPTFRYTP